MTTSKPARQPQAAVAATTTVAAPRGRQRRRGAVNRIARQYGGPSGPIGRLVTGHLARGNADFNRWLIHELGTMMPSPATVIELGCGPGIALRDQLRRHMPPIAQRTFPQEGFTLYDSDDQVAAALQDAGFTRPEVRVFGDPARPGGRLALATQAPGRPAGASGLTPERRLLGEGRPR